MYKYFLVTMCVFVQLFFVVGLPSVLTTDQGSEFNNKVNKQLMAAFKINHRLTTAYHPKPTVWMNDSTSPSLILCPSLHKIIVTAGMKSYKLWYMPIIQLCRLVPLKFVVIVSAFNVQILL